MYLCCRIIEIDDRFELGPSVWQQAKDGDDLILRFSLKLLANSFDELLHILAIFTEQLIFCEGFKHHKRHLHIDRRYWTFSLFLLGFACEPMVYECTFVLLYKFISFSCILEFFGQKTSPGTVFLLLQLFWTLIYNPYIW